MLFEMFLVQSANLIKEILKTAAYKPPKNAEIGKNFASFLVFKLSKCFMNM